MDIMTMDLMTCHQKDYQLDTKAISHKITLSKVVNLLISALFASRPAEVDGSNLNRFRKHKKSLEAILIDSESTRCQWAKQNTFPIEYRSSTKEYTKNYNKKIFYLYSQYVPDIIPFGVKFLLSGPDILIINHFPNCFCKFCFSLCQ